ncbi:MAG: hypothetical protein II604_09040, partial [Bacteroidales bacterium]|nr:hypothetical protein [Bacteroidales bacterium]
MKANIKLSVILLGIVFAFSFSSCERIKFDEDETADINRSRAILQEYETDGGDFAFLKSVIGMEVSAYDEYLTGNGYVECENSNAKYLDTRVDSISKYLHVHLSSGERIQNAEINVKNNDFDTLYAVFKTWMLEISRSSSYQLLVRKTFE